MSGPYRPSVRVPPRGRGPVLPAEKISILDGLTVAVSNRAGNMNASPDQPRLLLPGHPPPVPLVLIVNSVAPAVPHTDFPPQDLLDLGLSPKFAEIVLLDLKPIESLKERHFAPARLEIR